VAEISAQVVKDLRDKTGAGMMDCKRALAETSGDATRAAELLREWGLAKAVKRQGRETTEGAIGMATQGGVGALVELSCETDFVGRNPEFQALVTSLARAAAADPKAESIEALLGADVGGEKAEARIQAAIAKMGENMQLRRVARIAVSGSGRVGGYVHVGGKLGVLVALETAAAGAAVDALAKDLAMHVAAADPSPVAVDRAGVPAALVEKERELFRRQAEAEGKPAKILDKIVDGKIAKYFKDVCLLEQAFVKDPDRSVEQLLTEASKQAGAGVRVAGFVRFKLGESS
jgi:elongation factor Ts